MKQKAPGYYVSAIDGPRYTLIAGPFATHAEALAQVETERNRWYDLDPRAWFMAWGTCRVKPDGTPERVG